ncbi:MAG: peptidoglycan-binding domain-containing protein [candidate division SR1 bacterium]|nr:peptidoglycan-binding domain-containing protein [candidate division SR1 bacterium]
MRNLGKIMGISILCATFFLGFHTNASTGSTNQGTGSVLSGNILTGNSAPYTGSLLDYLTLQQSAVSGLFNTTYTKIYTLFSKTGLNIIKSIEYQSLVCLGAIKDESLLSQLQKDKTALMIGFKKDFIDLERQIQSLEEMKDLQETNGINMFDAGTSYESEKVRIRDVIDVKVKLHKGLFANFETSYLTKNTNFLSTFQQYSVVNKDLVKGIQDKMAKIQSVLTAFSGVTAGVNSINAKITGLGDFIQKMDDSKNKGLISLDRTIQTVIDSNVKKYKKLQNLSDDLEQQKSSLVGQYQMDLDGYLSSNLQTRYNRSQLLSLQNDINTFKAKYYTEAKQLNCSNLLSLTDESPQLLTRITAMKAMIDSGLVKIESQGIDSTFKDQLYSGFQSLYIQKFKQRYNEYGLSLKQYISTALRTLTTSLISTKEGTGSSDTGGNQIIVPSPEKNSSITFTKPFKSGEYNQDIKYLQSTLADLGIYTGAIDGIYSKSTKNAVYQFQLNKGLLVGYEKKPDTWGWMGPATRKALNNITK